MNKLSLLVIAGTLSGCVFEAQARDRYYDNSYDPYDNPVYQMSSSSYHTAYKNSSRYYKSKYYRGQQARSKTASSSLPNTKFTGPGKTFVFSPRHLRWYAYNEGRVVASGRASGGRGYCPDIHRSCRTPVGTYRVWSKGGAGCRSTRYPRPHGGAPMQYCMFFSKYYAVHGSNDVPNYNASHGCVRVEPHAAQWLSANFITHGTKVVVQPY